MTALVRVEDSIEYTTLVANIPTPAADAYRLPADLAARIAATTVREAVTKLPVPKTIFCCFDGASARHYEQAFAEQP